MPHTLNKQNPHTVAERETGHQVQKECNTTSKNEKRSVFFLNSKDAYRPVCHAFELGNTFSVKNRMILRRNAKIHA